jgi:hypothetical protein
MKVKLFCKPALPRCAAAKAVCRSVGKFFEYDITTDDGEKEAAMHDVDEVPTIVITDDYDNEIRAWRGEVPTGTDIKAALDIEV